jgi:protein-S-isoprenylcysteine O-methyltransferase Ste14
MLVPGLLLGYLPYQIALTDTPLFGPGIIRYLAVVFWTMGTVTMLWCFGAFTFRGRGTPAPIDPPKKLIAVGLYRFVRNPMYVSGIIILLGWLLWSPSLKMLLILVIFFTAAHLFITLYEEPTLRRKFGKSYEEYLQKVPRWVPKFR